MTPAAQSGDGNTIAPGSGVVPILKQLQRGQLKVVGTGFYITRYGLFATAAHVLSDLAEMDRMELGVGYVLEDRDGDELVIRRIAFASISNVADVALGQVENTIGNKPGTPNRRARLSLVTPTEGERLTTYAYPENEILDFTMSDQHPTLRGDYFEGVFERQVPPAQHPFVPYPHYETTLEIRSGASWCPIFNSKGEVAAISCRGWDFRGGEHENNNLSSVIPLGYLLSMNETCARPVATTWENEQIPRSRRGSTLSFGELVAYGHVDVGMFHY